MNPVVVPGASCPRGRAGQGIRGQDAPGTPEPTATFIHTLEPMLPWQLPTGWAILPLWLPGLSPSPAWSSGWHRTRWPKSIGKRIFPLRFFTPPPNSIPPSSISLMIRVKRLNPLQLVRNGARGCASSSPGSKCLNPLLCSGATNCHPRPRKALRAAGLSFSPLPEICAIPGGWICGTASACPILRESSGDSCDPDQNHLGSIHETDLRFHPGAQPDPPRFRPARIRYRWRKHQSRCDDSGQATGSRWPRK